MSAALASPGSPVPPLSDGRSRSVWQGLPSPDRRPWVVAHRGGGGEAPENTREAIQAARQAGAEAVEIDVRRTRDGVWVLLHDPTLDRTTDASGPVRNWNWADLRRVDAGFAGQPDGRRDFPWRGRGVTIPSLREILADWPELPLSVEVKEEDPAEALTVLETLRAAGAAERVLLGSFVDRVMRALRQAGREFATVAEPAQAAALYRWSRLGCAWLHRPRYDALSVPEFYGGRRVVDRRLVCAAHSHGRPLQVWTPNAAAEWERLAEVGVDALVTDFPRAALDWRNGRTQEGRPRVDRAE